MQTMHSARGARDRSRDGSDSLPPVGLGARCSAIAAHLARRQVASEKKTERSNARDRAPSASDSDRVIRPASDLVERGACCQRPRLRLTRETDGEFTIHLKFTSRTNGCTGAAIPASFGSRIFGRGPVILFVRLPEWTTVGLRLAHSHVHRKRWCVDAARIYD